MAGQYDLSGWGELTVIEGGRSRHWLVAGTVVAVALAVVAGIWYALALPALPTVLFRITVIVDHYANPTKAQQLNRALEVCMGDVIGVIDAEDDVAADLLVHTEALFERTGADVVQGGV